MAEVCIFACDIKKSFRQGNVTINVLNGICQQFFQGSTYGITGASGSGKSTLLHILAGLDQPTFGTVLYNNNDIASYTLQQKKLFLNKSLGLIFQLPYLIGELSVVENVMLKGIIDGQAKESCITRAHELLHKVGLYGKKDELPLSLSGGQQQRVAIVRALFNKPTFLLADEPTGNLDKKTREIIIELLLECQKEWNMGLIISSHDSYVIENMQTILHLDNGFLVTRNHKGTYAS